LLPSRIKPPFFKKDALVFRFAKKEYRIWKIGFGAFLQPVACSLT